MKVIATTVYEGPNIYAPVPVIHWRIDLEGLEEWPTGRLGAAFVDAVVECLPGLGGHGAFARAMDHALGKTAKEIGEGLGAFAPARQAASVETRTGARD